MTASFRNHISFALIAILLTSIIACGGTKKKKKKPRVAPIAQLADTNVMETEALGMRWYPFASSQMRFRFKLPRASYSDMVEKDSVIRFLGWVQPDTTMFKAGQMTYLANEPGFLFQVYKRPLISFSKEYFDFEDLGADFYRTNAMDKRRELTSGKYIMLQDSTVRAFVFDAKIDFGSGKRTPNFFEADRLEDEDENSQMRTNAKIVYLSHKRHNFRIIYEKGNPIAEGMFNSLVFF